MTSLVPIVRNAGEGDKRSFAGGGLHLWKLLAEETGGAFFLFEDTMVRDKMTPLHLHPEAHELTYVIDGEIEVEADGVRQRVRSGGVSFVPKGVAHAFIVVSAEARLIAIQTPGAVGQSFYRGASDPPPTTTPTRSTSPASRQPPPTTPAASPSSARLPSRAPRRTESRSSLRQRSGPTEPRTRSPSCTGPRCSRAARRRTFRHAVKGARGKWLRQHQRRCLIRARSRSSMASSRSWSIRSTQPVGLHPNPRSCWRRRRLVGPGHWYCHERSPDTPSNYEHSAHRRPDRHGVPNS